MSKSKNKNKLFIWTATLGTLGGVTLAGGGGFLVYYFTKDKKEHIRKENLGPWEDRSEDFLENTAIESYPVRKENGNISQALTKKEMHKLFKRFENEVPFGPEVFNLKSIIFDDVNFTLQGKEQGVYSPKTNQIGISTESIFQNDKANGIYNKLTSDEKIDKIFQVLYHEYGHHLFYTYQNSVSLDPKVESSMKVGSDDESAENFPTNFVKWFKNDFNYTDNSKKGQVGSNQDQISAYHSLKDMYDYSNVPNYQSQQILNSKKEYIYYDRDPGLPKGYQNLAIPTITNQNIPYMYSLQELLTRKFELSTLGFSEAAASTIYPKAIQNSNGKLGILSSNTMFVDYAHYKTLFLLFKGEKDWKNNLYNPQKWNNGGASSIIEQKFYNDDPFANSKENTSKKVSEVFAEKIAQRMGQQDASEVSLITSKNSFKIFTADTAMAPQETWKKDEGNNIRIGGYLKNYPKYPIQDIQNATTKYLAIDKGNNKVSDIKTIFKDLKAKTYAFEKNPSIDIGGSDNFWSTKDFVSASNISGKDLYLVYIDKNGNKQIIKLTSFKGDKDSNKTGITSTRLDHYPESNKDTFIWKAIKTKDGGVAIKKEGGA